MSGDIIPHEQPCGFVLLLQLGNSSRPETAFGPESARSQNATSRLPGKEQKHSHLPAVPLSYRATPADFSPFWGEKVKVAPPQPQSRFHPQASRSQKMRRALDGVSQTGDEHAPSLRREADPRKVKTY
jgi:hypothetical protein